MLKNVKRSFSAQLATICGYLVSEDTFMGNPFHSFTLDFCSCRRDHISWGKLLLEFFAKLPRFMGLSCAEKKTPSGTHEAPSCLCLPTFNFKVKDIGRVSISSTTTPEGARTLTEAKQKGNGRRGGKEAIFWGCKAFWSRSQLRIQLPFYDRHILIYRFSRMIFHHFSNDFPPFLWHLKKKGTKCQWAFHLQEKIEISSNINRIAIPCYP